MAHALTFKRRLATGFSFAILIAFWFPLAFPSPHIAAAMAVGCRGDPIVHLSNNDQLQIIIKIGTSDDQVQKIDYEIHAAAGISIKSITYTGGGLAGKEMVTLVNDGTDGIYVVDVQVTVAPATTSNSHAKGKISGGEDLSVPVQVIGRVGGDRESETGNAQQELSLSLTPLH